MPNPAINLLGRLHALSILAAGALLLGAGEGPDPAPPSAPALSGARGGAGSSPAPRPAPASPPLPDRAGQPPEGSGGLHLHRRAGPEALPAPRSWRLRLQARSFNLVVRDRSLDALKADDLVAAGQLSAGAELRLWRDLVLVGELGYSGGSSSGAVLQTFGTRLRQDSVFLGASIGWRLWDALMPYVRGGLAVTWLEASVSSSDYSLGGRDSRVGGFASAGIEVGVPRAWFGTSALSVSMHLEAGWAHLGRFRFEGGLDQSGLVDESLAGLGSVRLSGALVGTGLTVVF